MSTFPETSFTLLEKIGRLPPGQDEAAWQRLWELYTPALRQFVVWKGGERHADDIVQSVLAKLVDVLRSGQYRAERGRFHSYLATMAINEIGMQHRKDVARQQDRHVPIDNFISEDAAGEDRPKARTPDELRAGGAPAGESIDEDWRPRRSMCSQRRPSPPATARCTASSARRAAGSRTSRAPTASRATTSARSARASTGASSPSAATWPGFPKASSGRRAPRARPSRQDRTPARSGREASPCGP